MDPQGSLVDSRETRFRCPHLATESSLPFCTPGPHPETTKNQAAGHLSTVSTTVTNTPPCLITIQTTFHPSSLDPSAKPPHSPPLTHQNHSPAPNLANSRTKPDTSDHKRHTLRGTPLAQAFHLPAWSPKKRAEDGGAGTRFQPRAPDLLRLSSMRPGYVLSPGSVAGQQAAGVAG